MYQYGIIIGLIIGNFHPVSENQILAIFFICTAIAYPLDLKWWKYLLGICLGLILIKLIYYIKL